jgi:hypothetical protein
MNSVAHRGTQRKSERKERIAVTTGKAVRVLSSVNLCVLCVHGFSQ